MDKELHQLKLEMIRWGEKQESRFLEVLEKVTMVGAKVDTIEKHLDKLNGSVGSHTKEIAKNTNKIDNLRSRAVGIGIGMGLIITAIGIFALK